MLKEKTKPEKRMPANGKGEPVFVDRIVKQNFTAVLRVSRLPEERTKNDGILQAFTFVNGGQEDCVVVTFQPQLVLITGRGGVT